jgi:hypothetical protein
VRGRRASIAKRTEWRKRFGSMAAPFNCRLRPR